MSQIYTLKDIDNSNDTKLGEKPFNRYPPSYAELKEQHSRAVKDCERILEATNRLIVKHENLQGELYRLQKENERIQASLDQLKKDNNALNDVIEHIQYSLNQTIIERDDIKHLESLKDQVAERCEVLNEENKYCIFKLLSNNQKKITMSWSKKTDVCRIHRNKLTLMLKNYTMI